MNLVKMCTRFGRTKNPTADFFYQKRYGTPSESPAPGSPAVGLSSHIHFIHSLISLPLLPQPRNLRPQAVLLIHKRVAPFGKVNTQRREKDQAGKTDHHIHDNRRQAQRQAADQEAPERLPVDGGPYHQAKQHCSGNADHNQRQVRVFINHTSQHQVSPSSTECCRRLARLDIADR